MLTKNDVLRRLRYLLDLDDRAMLDLLALGGHRLTRPDLLDRLRRDGEPGYTECEDETLNAFLDGLILHRRGPRKDAPDPGPHRPPEKVTNNLILRKLRIALELDEAAMLGVFKLAGLPLSRSELSAFFRKPDHQNYRPCGDQALRNFLTGLGPQLGR